MSAAVINEDRSQLRARDHTVSRYDRTTARPRKARCQRRLDRRISKSGIRGRRRSRVESVDPLPERRSGSLISRQAKAADSSSIRSASIAVASTSPSALMRSANHAPTISTEASRPGERGRLLHLASLTALICKTRAMPQERPALEEKGCLPVLAAIRHLPWVAGLSDDGSPTGDQ